MRLLNHVCGATSVFLCLLAGPLLAVSQSAPESPTNHPTTPGLTQTVSPVVSQATPEFRSVLFGHNLTPTTDTLPKGAVTLGNYVAGVGVTDRLTFASSPWLYESYNMYSAIVKFRGCLSQGETKCDWDWAVQSMYLKTGHFGLNSYQMTALSSSFIVKKDFADFYSVNFAVNYMYFFDETNPFSLRREPYNDDPYQFSVTTLQEVRLPGHFGLLVEAGMLGLNYVYPEIHIGLSMSHRSRFTLAQIGFSQTFTSGTVSRLFSTQQTQALGGGEPGYDFSMHPEVQFQVFY
jgi:hypothetical protein